MNNFWLKLKIWTKTTIAAVVLIYALLFIAKNSGQAVEFWYFPFKPTVNTSMLLLIAGTFLAGVVATLIVRTTFSTLRQVRELRARSRIDKLERDQASIKVKAAMLQRMPESIPAVGGPASTLPVTDSE